MKHPLLKYFLFCFYILGFTAFSFAQIPETPAISKKKSDSLLSALNFYQEHSSKQNDTTRLNVLLNLAERSNGDSVKLFIKEAMKLCNSYSPVIANSEKQFADNLKQEIKNDVFVNYYLISKAKILRLIGNCEINDDKKLESYLTSLKLCEKIRDKEGLAASYIGISDVYAGQNNYDKGMDNIMNAQKIYKEINDNLNYARTFYLIGNIYLKEKKYQETLKNFSTALKLSKESNSLFQTSLYYESIGNLYLDRGEYDKALVNHIASLKLSQKLNDIKGIADTYGDIASIYSKMKNYQKALDSHLAALKKYKEFSNPHLIASSYKNIAESFAKLNKYNDALDNLYASLETYKKIKENEGMAESFYSLSEVYLFKHDYSKAIEYLKSAINISKELNNLESIKNAYKKLAEIYSIQGEYKNAYQYHQLYTNITDSIKSNTDETEKQIQSIQNKFDKERKEQERHLQEAQDKAERTQRYALYGGLALLLVFGGFMFNRYRITRRQKGIIESQKHLVEEKNREITQSIEYALRIQTAILPPQRIVKQELENSFILYIPKDIVAGDFYWMENLSSKFHVIGNDTLTGPPGFEQETILFAACDCTGHGVPGAMVSVVCHNALNRAVREFGLSQPAAILDKTTEIVIEYFSQSEEAIKDGMDISLASIKYNASNSKALLEWAGANNPLYLIRNGELTETKADKQPIGRSENKKPFVNHQFNLERGDSIYLFTDGYADQFGGDDGGKKLTKKRFRELLLSLQNKTMPEQGLALNKFILEYRKDVEQIDDILVMGVRI